MSKLVAGMDIARLEYAKKALQAFVDEGKVAGARALVVRHGKVVLDGAVGYADKEEGIKLKDDSIFRIYSMTKVFTTVAMMILYERGLYKLHDPIAQFLPAYGEMQVVIEGKDGAITYEKAKRPITFYHLFTMTSGIQYPGDGSECERQVGKIWFEANEARKAGQPWDTQRMINESARAPLAFHPGEKWQYGFSIDVLGALVEVLSGKKLSVFFEDEIFKPLGLTDTAFYVPKEKQHRFVQQYVRNEEGHLVPMDKVNDGAFAYSEPVAFESGGGGMVSTASDITKFAQMLLGDGEANGVRLLSPKTVALIRADHLTPSQKLDYNWEGQRGYSYGLAVRTMVSPSVAGSNGSVGEWGWDGMAGTWFCMDPLEDMTIVFLIQRVPGDHYEMLPRFLQAIYGAMLE